MLINGILGESPEGGVAIGEVLAVVVGKVVLLALVGVLVVDIVVVRATAGEQAVVTPHQVHLGYGGNLVLYQAATEVVIAVIGVDQEGIGTAVGHEVASVPVTELVIVLFCHPPLGGVGHIGVPVELPLIAATERKGQSVGARYTCRKRCCSRGFGNYPVAPFGLFIHCVTRLLASD